MAGLGISRGHGERYLRVAVVLLLVIHVHLAVLCRLWHPVVCRNAILSAQDEEPHDGYTHDDPPRKGSEVPFDYDWRE
jgi:hypothetical protein